MSARADPCGGRSAMVVPTATSLPSKKANRRRKLVKWPVSVEKSQFTTHLFVPASLLVIHFLCFSRPGSWSCNLRGWFTAEESHQPFQVLRRCRQIELFAYEAHPAQPQSA